MSVYLDASVLVALFVEDSVTAKARAYLEQAKPTVVVSDFARVEFASALARRVRMRVQSADDARTAFANFDAWVSRAARREELASSDTAAAEAFLRRLDLTLRAADALNIAVAQRLGATLATFDSKMAACAIALGTPVADL